MHITTLSFNFYFISSDFSDIEDMVVNIDISVVHISCLPLRLLHLTSILNNQYVVAGRTCKSGHFCGNN